MSQHELVFALRDRGYRVTSQRRALLDALWQLDGHFTADAVQAALRQQGQRVDLSTIYRTLELLTDLGLLHMLHGTSPAEYERVHDQSHHHLICEQCGHVGDVSDSHLDALYHHLREEHRFVARLNHLAIPGLCADCWAEQEKVNRT
ncbi:MAG: transcriptional repressor [Anaerolineales bacterium]|nr:transcriptional repressor [Anaerolineales bacterium]